MLLFSVSYLALSTVLIGGIELLCFRCREIGQAAKQRKQYTDNVVKVVLPGVSGALVTVLVLEPGIGNEILQGFPTYPAALSLIAVIVVAVISYRLEVSSEAPSTIHDLYSDLRYLWTEEMILSRHSLVRHRTWLEGFKATNGGRSMAASKRALDPRFQAAVDVSLAGNYRDVRFTRLARRTTPRMVGAMMRGHPWRATYVASPIIAAVLMMASVPMYLTMENHPYTPASVLILQTAIIIAGILLSAFNIWARSTSRLRKYCELKRREELCTLMLKRLKVLATSTKTTASPQQQTPPGLIRHLLRALW